MSETEHTKFNNAALITDDMIHALRPYATKLTRAAGNHWDPDDLINASVVSVLNSKQDRMLTDIAGLLVREIEVIRKRWIMGSHPGKPCNGVPLVQRLLSSRPFPEDDSKKAIRVDINEEEHAFHLDVQKAWVRLSPEAQRVLYQHFWEGRTLDEIVKLGRGVQKKGRVNKNHVCAVMREALEILRVELSAYAPPARAGKRLPEKCEESV